MSETSAELTLPNIVQTGENGILQLPTLNEDIVTALLNRTIGGVGISGFEEIMPGGFYTGAISLATQDGRIVRIFPTADGRLEVQVLEETSSIIRQRRPQSLSLF